jgi:hypothetical protein
MTNADAHHHRRTLRGIVLIMSAVFMFSAMDTLAKHMRRLSDAADQAGTH